jgi:AhpD family alkylhydroperoxidase
MQKRLRYGQAYPDAYKAMLALSQVVEKTGLAPQLIDLVNYRVSLLNGCAFCLDMHSKDLRARGDVPRLEPAYNNEKLKSRLKTKS